MIINFDKSKQLNRSAWLKLMGVKPNSRRYADISCETRESSSFKRLENQMADAEKLLYEAADPRFTYRILSSDQLDIQGISLKKHLEGCSRIIIMAVTLGIGVDNLIRRTQARSMAAAAVTDFGASVMTELAADMATEEIRSYVAELAETEHCDLFTTARFSPGYGDSSLDIQKQLLNFLNAERRLGITLTEGCMLIPRKSITGIIGLSDHPVSGRPATCSECVLKDKCTLRMEGRRCY